MTMDADFTIRTASPEDAPAISRLYNGFVRECTCTWQLEPETVEERRALLTGRRPEHPVFVAVAENDDVMAFASLSPYSTRGGFAGTAEVGIYIDDAAQGRGLGSRLMKTLIEHAQAGPLRVLISRISDDQTASLALHKKFGFLDGGHIPDCGLKFGRRLGLTTLYLPVGYDTPASTK